MSTPTNQSQSAIEALGCGLVLMGVVGGAFALAALLGVSDRVELEFFGIELDDTRGRLIWLAGSVAAVVVGVRMLCARGRAA